MERLSAGIIAWRDCLTGALQEDSIDTTMDTTATAPAQFKSGGIPELEVFHTSILSLFFIVCCFQIIRHEVHITNQMMHLQPPVEMSRTLLIVQLHRWICVVTTLPRIQSTRYQVSG